MNVVPVSTEEARAQGELWLVRDIRCPIHGDVTLEIAGRLSGPWSGFATTKIIRGGAVHSDNCPEQLLWSLFPRHRGGQEAPQ